MGWFTNKLMQWSTVGREREMTDFIRRMEAMDSDEVALPLVAATVFRNGVLPEINLLYPAAVLLADPTICLQLNRTIQELQSQKHFPAAAGVMVWLHSMRAMEDLTLRNYGRQIWHELQRGFPFASDWAYRYVEVTGCDPDLVKGWNQIPDGLEPRK
jgi:hypothetical protein